MSLIFNMLSRLVIDFLPRSKHLLFSWLQSPSVVILEPRKKKVCHDTLGLSALETRHFFWLLDIYWPNKTRWQVDGKLHESRHPQGFPSPPNLAVAITVSAHGYSWINEQV